MVSYRIHFQWSIDIDIDNTFYGEYRYRYCQNLFKASLTTLMVIVSFCYIDYINKVFIVSFRYIKHLNVCVIERDIVNNIVF